MFDFNVKLFVCKSLLCVVVVNMVIVFVKIRIGLVNFGIIVYYLLLECIINLF